jgi:hypothetical protein
MARGAAAIPARCPLGHDALEPELGGGRKEPDAVALEVVTELDRGPGILLDQPPEEHPFHERLPPQILAIEMQEIEGEQQEPVRRRVDSRSKGMKIGDAVLVLDHHLAIDQGRFAGQLAASIDHPPIDPSGAHVPRYRRRTRAISRRCSPSCPSSSHCRCG